MADTGVNWEANWTELLASQAQQEGEASEDITTDEVDLDGKAGCLISFDTDYSDHVKATGGLAIHILRDVNDTVWESVGGESLTFEMPFTQNATERKTIALSAEQFQKFNIYLQWLNSTTDAIATTVVNIKYSTIPVAS